MTATIRLATRADAAALAGLRWDFRAEYRAPVESHDAFLERCTAWMAPRLEPGGPWHCWLAEDGDVPIASLWLCVLEKLPNPVGEPESHAYITSVYVAPAYRGAGLGARLMQAAMDFAAGSGCDSAILWPTPRSRTLYERFGFAVRDDVMEAVITPGREL